MDTRHLAVAAELFCPSELYFFNPPGTGKPVAWHQDSWYLTHDNTAAADESLPTVSIGT